MRDLSIPTCNIMGVDIAAVDMPYVVAYIEECIDSLRGNYICVSNVHTTVTAADDSSYRDIQNSSAMSIPDGGPLSAIGRRRGHECMARTAGPDLMRILLSRSSENRLKHYFFGSSAETLDRLSSALERDYPSASVAGMLSPPFREPTKQEDRDFVKSINGSGADIVWVGLGAPKQELWMAAHEGRVNALMIGVGAGFDYLAGNISRAPAWMRNHSLEWLYRLMQEPTRLFGRYAGTNGKFLWRAVVLGE